MAPRRAKAQSAPSQKCFVHFRTPHGGVASANMWPADAALTDKAQYLHEIRRGALTATARGADAVLSPVLTARASLLTPSLLAKMNLLRGLDVTVLSPPHTVLTLGILT